MILTKYELHKIKLLIVDQLMTIDCYKNDSSKRSIDKIIQQQSKDYVRILNKIEVLMK